MAVPSNPVSPDFRKVWGTTCCCILLRCRGPLLRVSCPCSIRSEEHTSELQSRSDLVCRLLLEKKKKRELIRHERRRPSIRRKPGEAREDLRVKQQGHETVVRTNVMPVQQVLHVNSIAAARGRL